MKSLDVQNLLMALTIIGTLIGGFTVLKTDITALQVTVSDMKERALEDRKSMREQLTQFEIKMQKLTR